MKFKIVNILLLIIWVNMKLVNIHHSFTAFCVADKRLVTQSLLPVPSSVADMYVSLSKSFHHLAFSFPFQQYQKMLKL